MMNIETTGVSHCTELHARVLIEELARLGLTHLCIAPGSRSSPLLLAAKDHPTLTLHVHFDERGLGFFALGLAQALRQPVAVLTTSGTAVANLVPAAVEADQQDIPLLWLTADRPAELYQCAANQTINQPPLLVSLVRHQCCLSADETLPLPQLLTAIDDTWDQLALGPVHINMALREPLYPSQENWPCSTLLAPISHWLNTSDRWQLPLAEPPPPILPTATQWQTFCNDKGVIVAGALTPQEATAVSQLQQQLNWPLLVDVQSQLQGRPEALAADRLLRDKQHRITLSEAKNLLWFGDRIVSKHLLSFVSEHFWNDSWQVCRIHGRRDAGTAIHTRFSSAPDHWLRSLPVHNATPWAGTLYQRQQAEEQRLAEQLSHDFSECAALFHLGTWLPPQSLLFVGNSLPIRILDSIGRLPNDVEVFTNRGASGIDGLIATATGIAKGRQQPMTLLIGDQSFLYDLNSLALTMAQRTPLVILLFNNGGGNIFDMLPVPDDQTRDRYFRASHGLIFNNIAQQFACHYHCPNTMIELQNIYRQALQHSGTTLIEMVTTPGSAVQQWQQLWST